MLPGRDATSVRSGLGKGGGVFLGLSASGQELERWSAAGGGLQGYDLHGALFGLSHMGFFPHLSASEVRQAERLGFSGPMLHVVFSPFFCLLHLSYFE